MKTALIIIAVTLLAVLVLLGSRPDERFVARDSDTSPGPSFEVKVVRPLSARPLFGLLPAELEARLLGDGDLRFDNDSRGAAIGNAGEDRLELSADGWDLLIETDGEGGVAPGTRLVFPVMLAGKKRTLSCRPADRASGYLRTSIPGGSDEFDGRFLIKLATCENVGTGKTIEWPPAPLTVRGSFEGLPRGGR